MTNGYLSQDKAHLAKRQRERRARMVRIDYMPGDLARAVIESKRKQCRPGSQAATNSAVLDAIVCEWARLTGINYEEVDPAMTSEESPELINRYARAFDFGKETPESPPPTRADRATCGAKRRRDGYACQAKPEPGKRRCRFHGGKSTGPKTAEGRARSLANLRRKRGSTYA